MNIEIDEKCFRCGDKIEGPFMAMGGFVKGNPYILSLHLDCYFAIAVQFADRFECTKKMILESDKRPQG